jgi:hypothetical protein
LLRHINQKKLSRFIAPYPVHGGNLSSPQHGRLTYSAATHRVSAKLAPNTIVNQDMANDRSMSQRDHFMAPLS